MKKILLGTFAIGMCFVLSACGTSQNDATLTKLGNQLDETANTISKIQTLNPTEFPRNSYIIYYLFTIIYYLLSAENRIFGHITVFREEKFLSVFR